MYEEATPIGSVGEEKNTQFRGLLANGEVRAYETRLVVLWRPKNTRPHPLVQDHCGGDRARNAFGLSLLMHFVSRK